ncbi:MAG: hypothetical protein AAFN78_05720 [Pseudomonadota bacterium]
MNTRIAPLLVAACLAGSTAYAQTDDGAEQVDVGAEQVDVGEDIIYDADDATTDAMVDAINDDVDDDLRDVDGDAPSYEDEIKVLGQMNRYQLGRAVVRARLDFWDVYNALNDVDEYRIICERVEYTGSKLRKLRCEPVYYREMSRQLTQRSLQLQAGFNPASQRSINSHVKKKKEEADAYMIGLIEENPELWRKWAYLLEAYKTLQRARGRE